MLRYLTAFWAGLLVAVTGTAASAGFFVCNDSGVEVSVAIGWTINNRSQVHGWYNVKPRGCTLPTPLEGPINGGYYYYYAEGGGLTWEDNVQGGFYCADHKNKFDYGYANNEYQSGQACEGYNFREINIGESTTWKLRLTETTTDPKTAAINCQNKLSEGSDAFISCWTRQVATNRQRQILDCVQNTNTSASLAICASKGYLNDDAQKAADCSLKLYQDKSPGNFARCLNNGYLDPKTEEVTNCAINNHGNYSAIASCAAGTQLSPYQRRLYDCAAQYQNDYRAAGLCMAGTQLSPEQQRIANCVIQNRGSYVQMGVCAAGNNLTPEQQAFASCAISTGGQPYAFAACVGTQLTVNELNKCLSQGIGGNGCFGDNNTAVKFVKNAWKDVTEGPGPSNDLVGRDGYVARTLVSES